MLPGEQAEPLEPPPAALTAGLAAQIDLRELPSEGGALVFANTAWNKHATDVGVAASPGGTPGALRILGAIFELALWRRRWRLGAARRRRRAARPARAPLPGDDRPTTDEAPPTTEMPVLVGAPAPGSDGP